MVDLFVVLIIFYERFCDQPVQIFQVASSVFRQFDPCVAESINCLRQNSFLHHLRPAPFVSTMPFPCNRLYLSRKTNFIDALIAFYSPPPSAWITFVFKWLFYFFLKLRHSFR